MQLKQLFADEDAVSPVIGVILMVAITVILAAVIGTFVLGLGENVQDSAPQANFQFEYDDGATTGDDEKVVTITHTGGEDIDSSNVEVSESGDADLGVGPDAGDDWPTTISTGSQFVSDEQATSSNTIRVIWTSPSGGNSNTIGQSTVPS